jgi:DNA repair protein RecO (recombination protein O)
MASIKDQAIVLKYIKYSESSLIVHVYTRLGGRQTLMVYGIGGKKRNKLVYFQPLYLLDIDYSLKTNRDIHQLKEFKLDPPLPMLSTDIRKSTLALFIADILYNTLLEEHSDENLFDFIKASVLILDNLESGFAWFHIVFLVKLSRFLGYQLDFTQGGQESIQWFDMQKNQPVTVKPLHNYSLSKQEIEKISLLAQTPFNQLNTLEIYNNERNKLLEVIVDIYENYSLNFKSLQSFKVLKDVFS